MFAQADRLPRCLQGGWLNRILARLADEMSRYNPIHYVPQADRLLCCLQGGWQNRILARLANEMSRYNPIHYVPQVKARVLMVATTKDALCSINVARRAASLNPFVRLVEKDAGE